jgi:hypothetical protein
MLRTKNLAALINRNSSPAFGCDSNSNSAHCSAAVTIKLVETTDDGQERHVLIRRVLDKSATSTTQIQIQPDTAWRLVKAVSLRCPTTISTSHVTMNVVPCRTS